MAESMWRRAGSQLLLSDLVPSDEVALATLLADGTVAARTRLIPHPYGPAQARQFIAFAEEARRRLGRTIVWAIREIDGPLVGCIGIDEEENASRAELGYWIGAPFQRRGYATAAAARITEVALVEYEIDEVFAHVVEGNEPSRKVLEKVGFQKKERIDPYPFREGTTVVAWRFEKRYSED